MPKKRKPGVDPFCVDLAEHFLAPIKQATAEDKNELAERLQQLCEEHAAEIIGVYSEDDE